MQEYVIQVLCGNHIYAGDFVLTVLYMYSF